jgi:hypothetical protein
MNPIPVILILLAVASVFYVTLSALNSFPKMKKETLLKNLSRIGEAHNLIFCSQEILQNKVMGFDGVHKKIIILGKIKNTYNYSIISLKEVQDCHLIAGEGLQCRGNHNNRGSNFYPNTLELQFEFINHSQSASIEFCNGNNHSKREFEFFKAKAEYWCIMFSKMLNRQIEARA